METPTIVTGFLAWLAALEQQYPWLAPLSAILGSATAAVGMVLWLYRKIVGKAHRIRRKVEEKNERLEADITALRNEVQNLRGRLPEAGWQGAERERLGNNEESAIRALRHHVETEGARLSEMARQIAHFHLGLVTEQDRDRHLIPAERFALLAFHLDPRNGEAELLKEVQQLRGAAPFEHVQFRDDVFMTEDDARDYYSLPEASGAVAALIDDALRAIDRGQYRHAHALADSAFLSARRWMGNREPLALSARYCRAMALERLGRSTEALAEIDGTEVRPGILSLEEQSPDLGPTHPQTLSTRRLRALILRSIGRCNEALAEIDGIGERLGILPLSDQNPDLGPTHPDTLATGSLRGAILWDLGRYEESERQLRAVGCTQEEALGPVHHDTLATGHRLATTLIALRRLSEAEDMLGAVIEGQRQSLGYEHPDTRAAIADLEALRERRKTDPPA
jgi:Tetratricopeptide repeat